MGKLLIKPGTYSKNAVLLVSFLSRASAQGSTWSMLYKWISTVRDWRRKSVWVCLELLLGWGQALKDRKRRKRGHPQDREYLAKWCSLGRRRAEGHAGRGCRVNLKQGNSVRTRSLPVLSFTSPVTLGGLFYVSLNFSFLR